MKIIFFCSSSEDGKDGVGDYTKKLAANLSKKGINTLIVSINDKYEHHIWQGIQEVDDIQLKSVRLSNLLLWNKKIAFLNKLIQEFQPDWVSLQYVPYGFNKKGIPFYLPYNLSKLKGNFKWHIMFHEVWIGISTISPFSHKVYGYFQKKIVERLLKTLKPELITTTNVLYQLVLKEKKIEAKRLPLFSNINNENEDADYLQSIEKRYNVSFKDDSYYKLGIFGTLYPEANLSFVIPQFLNQNRVYQKTIIIIFGKNNRPEELNKLKRNLKQHVIFAELGELSEKKVSTVMNILDEAILCTPLEFIGKSGAYAALRLHKVKVAILSSSPIPKYEKEVLNYNNHLQQKNAEEWSVNSVANRFCKLLSSEEI